jgi:hypothetical protein
MGVTPASLALTTSITGLLDGQHYKKDHGNLTLKVKYFV